MMQYVKWRFVGMAVFWVYFQWDIWFLVVVHAGCILAAGTVAGEVLFSLFGVTSGVASIHDLDPVNTCSLKKKRGTCWNGWNGREWGDLGLFSVLFGFEFMAFVYIADTLVVFFFVLFYSML